MQNQQKKESGLYGFLIILIIILIALITFLTVYVVLPELIPILPGISEKVGEGLEGVRTDLGELASAIEGERIEELSPEQLPREALPERSLYNLERETFNLMNQERIQRGLNILEWQEAISNTAFKHSKEMYLNDYINHTNLDGLGVDGRLSNDNLFHLCSSENIFFIESRHPKSDLAEKAVEGWLSSIGHRRNLLDENITRAGVGIYCEDRKCYVTANHICTTTEIKEILQKGYVYLFSLYPDEAQFKLPAQITIYLTATGQLDVFIVPNKEQYRKYARRENFLFTKKYEKVTRILDTTVIEKGYGMMIVPEDDSKLNVKIVYL